MLGRRRSLCATLASYILDIFGNWNLLMELMELIQDSDSDFLVCCDDGKRTNLQWISDAKCIVYACLCWLLRFFSTVFIFLQDDIANCDALVRKSMPRGHSYHTAQVYLLQINLAKHFGCSRRNGYYTNRWIYDYFNVILVCTILYHDDSGMKDLSVGRKIIFFWKIIFNTDRFFIPCVC